jgi:hypothetical protein
MGNDSGRSARESIAATAIARVAQETQWRLRGQNILALQVGERVPASAKAKP